MQRYATCDLRCVLHMLCMYLDISLSECYLGLMERWGREASKTELKDMFQLSNDIYASQKEDITLFDSKSTSIHSLIIQYV